MKMIVTETRARNGASITKNQVRSEIKIKNRQTLKSDKAKTTNRAKHHLVTPEHGEPPLAALPVNAGLLHHALEDGEGGGLAVDVCGHRQLDTGLVVVLGAGHGSEPGAFARRVVKAHADLA